ncbi:Uncharacterised protein [Slackia heliotrinireducens]|nr:helix-turn-helix transcriptional regulator [Slackia heliotrinireducens]VEH02081.1 Uncharacterised protein [Slackia heliotrinireducens]
MLEHETMGDLRSYLDEHFRPGSTTSRMPAFDRLTGERLGGSHTGKFASRSIGSPSVGLTGSAPADVQGHMPSGAPSAPDAMPQMLPAAPPSGRRRRLGGLAGRFRRDKRDGSASGSANLAESATKARRPPDYDSQQVVPAAPAASGGLGATGEISPVPTGMDEWLAGVQKGFGERLLDAIDARGLDDATVYKRAGVDRRLFSKIRSNLDYRPSKNTALALAVALEMDIDETCDLLGSAGLALSDASRFDLIVKFFILNGRFDRFEINEALYRYGESMLGA